MDVNAQRINARDRDVHADVELPLYRNAQHAYVQSCVRGRSALHHGANATPPMCQSDWTQRSAAVAQSTVCTTVAAQHCAVWFRCSSTNAATAAQAQRQSARLISLRSVNSDCSSEYTVHCAAASVSVFVCTQRCSTVGPTALTSVRLRCSCRYSTVPTGTTAVLSTSE